MRLIPASWIGGTARLLHDRVCGYRLIMGTCFIRDSSLDHDHYGAMIGKNQEGLGTLFI